MGITTPLLMPNSTCIMWFNGGNGSNGLNHSLFFKVQKVNLSRYAAPI